jgi:chromosome segregation ATPase
MPDEKDPMEMLKGKGFDSIEKVLETLESLKADVSKHKTRATAVTDLQTQLEQLQAEKQARDDAEKTELQKLTDKVKQMEAQAEQARRDAVAAQRSAMLERGIAEHLNTVAEPLRPLAGDYLRTVLPSREWQDGEGLATALKESLDRFTGLAPESLRVVKGGTPPPKGQEPAPTQPKAFDYLAAIGRG